MANMIEAIKKTAVEAVMAGNPTSIIYGKVISGEPLQVQVNSKLTLDETFLVLTKNVSDYEAEVDINFSGEGLIAVEGEAEKVLKKLSVSGATITIKNGLKTGDDVVMVQAQGGQEYVIIDKVKAGE